MHKTWQDRYVEIDAVRAHYIESGRGQAETVLLIHGGGAISSAEMNYGAIMEPLGRHFRVIALDVVGFGETPPRGPQDYPAAAQGDFIVKFLAEMDLSAHVGGNSHGGWLAQYVAHEAPERTRRLIIINSLNGSSPLPPEPEGLQYIHSPEGHAHEPPTLERMRATMSRLYVNQNVVTDEHITRGYEIASRNYEFAMARGRAMNSTVADANRNLEYRGRHISEYADQLGRPVLLTWSRENNGSTPSDAARFLERFEDAELYVFIQAGHHVMTEHPERWSQVVAEFLNSPR